MIVYKNLFFKSYTKIFRLLRPLIYLDKNFLVQRIGARTTDIRWLNP